MGGISGPRLNRWYGGAAVALVAYLAVLSWIWKEGSCFLSPPPPGFFSMLQLPRPFLQLPMVQTLPGLLTAALLGLAVARSLLQQSEGA
jgi:hypothetical protein